LVCPDAESHVCVSLSHHKSKKAASLSKKRALDIHAFLRTKQR
jgi:hypothetical protein